MTMKINTVNLIVATGLAAVIATSAYADEVPPCNEACLSG